METIRFQATSAAIVVNRNVPYGCLKVEGRASGPEMPLFGCRITDWSSFMQPVHDDSRGGCLLVSWWGSVDNLAAHKDV